MAQHFETVEKRCYDYGCPIDCPVRLEYEQAGVRTASPRHRRRWSLDEVVGASLLVWIVGVLAAIAVILCSGCGPSACEKAGGHIEHVNCRTEMNISVMNTIDAYGNISTMPITTWDRVCDEVCVGRKDDQWR